MTTLESTTDAENLTLTFAAEFDASPTRVWELWADPRQLERWWGPPTWPATFVEHSPVEGGSSKYFMTGPEGERSSGWWRFLEVAPPDSLAIEDGFADADGDPDQSMPTIRMNVAFEKVDGDRARTRMTIVNRYASAEQFEKLLEMGMREGMSLAIGQIEGILLDRSSPAAG